MNGESVKLLKEEGKDGRKREGRSEWLKQRLHGANGWKDE